MPPLLVVGLGNPGTKYQDTRHNAGVWLVQSLCKDVHFKAMPKLNASISPKLDLVARGLIAAIPHTYMNESGQAVGALARYFNLEAKAVLVVHDELDLAPGVVQFKSGGGLAGHNGLKSVAAHLGTNEFHRIRIGIGHPGHRDLVSDYVLSKPSQDEAISISNAIDSTVKNFQELVVKNGL